MTSRNAAKNDHAQPRVRSLDRRAVLRASGAVGAAAALSATVRSADADASSPLVGPERAMVLDLARALAIIPVPFPSFGEQGSASSRVTADRVDGAFSRLRTERAAEALSGARTLIAAGLLAEPPKHVALGVGRLVAAGVDKASPPLRSVVALAIATVSTHFDPNADNAADLWLDVVRRLHLRNEQETADGASSGGGR